MNATIEPPKDGTPIIVDGRLIYFSECCTVAETILGAIQWTEKPGQYPGWHFLNGMSVAQTLDDAVIIDWWTKI